MFEPISRKEYHEKKWKKVYSLEDCPFCNKENEEKNNRIIWQWKHWHIIYNLSSYSWDNRHIMAIPNEHILYSYDLKKEHFEELSEVHKIVKDFFKDDSYFSFTRESMSNRSVEHLHMHFLVWKLQWKFLRKMLELQWFPIKESLELK